MTVFHANSWVTMTSVIFHHNSQGVNEIFFQCWTAFTWVFFFFIKINIFITASKGFLRIWILSLKRFIWYFCINTKIKVRYESGYASGYASFYFYILYIESYTKSEIFYFQNTIKIINNGISKCRGINVFWIELSLVET